MQNKTQLGRVRTGQDFAVPPFIPMSARDVGSLAAAAIEQTAITSSHVLLGNLPSKFQPERNKQTKSAMSHRRDPKPAMPSRHGLPWPWARLPSGEGERRLAEEVLYLHSL